MASCKSMRRCGGVAWLHSLTLLDMVPLGFLLFFPAVLIFCLVLLALLPLADAMPSEHRHKHGPAVRHPKTPKKPQDTTWTFRLGNCVADTMTFESCQDVVGTLLTQPTDIPGNQAVNFTVSETSSGTTGNCTWSYANSNGKWVAFLDWFVQPFGDNDFGAGTNDDIDDEVTNNTTPFFNVVCTVFAYHVSGEEACELQTDPTSAGCITWGQNGNAEQQQRIKHNFNVVKVGQP
jgi:hypothetical protein